MKKLFRGKMQPQLFTKLKMPLLYNSYPEHTLTCTNTDCSGKTPAMQKGTLL
jgi:hypothetical protein